MRNLRVPKLNCKIRFMWFSWFFTFAGVMQSFFEVWAWGWGLRGAGTITKIQVKVELV
jgi:hypothetical protein